ncbi:hypothetical protein [Limnohabitans sp. 2KL-17]|uniref:hypothetical protein n=1 Tax=Limnohabitans sp. 2KL-17 TaxID=1100704 RepID=UPI0011B28F8D|nr:hypothetical protein [Limnohabitans sp. 2KL-17]
MLPIQRADSIQQYVSVKAKEECVGFETEPIHEKIMSALSQIGNLGLRRDNRVGFPQIDNGAKNIRQVRDEKDAAINNFEYDGRTDQEVVAQATRDTLNNSHGAQAFCGEHAYFMRDALADLGISQDNMNVIHAEAQVYAGKEGVRRINHAFLLYSDKQFTPGQLLSDHIAQSDDNRYIVIDAWASKKISEYKGGGSAIRRADFIHEYIGEVMREVDSKYRSPRTISYGIDNPYSNKKPGEGSIKRFYNDRPFGACDDQPSSKRRKLDGGS